MLAQFRAAALRYALIAVGIGIGAVSLTVFLQPLDIAPAGVAGASTLLNELFDTPIGFMIFLLNIPIQLLGYILLPNGARVILRSVVIIMLFSIVVDNLRPHLPATGLSDDRMLNALFGGITGGIGVGLVYRAGATFGGTSTLALILQRRFGFPMSTTFLCTDTLIIAAAGLVYGWGRRPVRGRRAFHGGLGDGLCARGTERDSHGHDHNRQARRGRPARLRHSAARRHQLEDQGRVHRLGTYDALRHRRALASARPKR